MSPMNAAGAALVAPQLSNFGKIAEAGLEVANAALELEAAVMGNALKSAREAESKCVHGTTQPVPQPPAAKPGAAKGANQFGGILQQLMQLLQMLVPMIQQLANGRGPQANVPAMNVANQLPQASAPSPLGSPGTAPAAGRQAAVPMVPVIAMVPASALQTGAIPVQPGATTPLLGGAPVAAAPIAAAPVQSALDPAGWSTVQLGANSPEAAMAWVHETLAGRSISAADMQQGIDLYNIFNSGTY
jgi:hypothetical protein